VEPSKLPHISADACRMLRAKAGAGCKLLWYKKPPARSYAYHRFQPIGSRWCMELLDIGGSMGTVPRQESVSNSSMHHREL
jgi:hypothetical protein